MTGFTRRSEPGRSWRLTLATAVAALIGVLVALRLLLGEATADAAERRRGPAASAVEPTRAELPTPGSAGTQALAPADVGAELPAAPAAAPPSAGRFAGLATLPREAFHGRVLDPDGRPVPGARVSFVPAHAAFHALGHDLWWAHQLEPDELSSTVSDARGEFTIEGPHLESCIDGAQTGDTWAAEPGLVAWAPGFAAHPHVCTGYRGGSCEVGDLLVEPEGRLHGRVVDPAGRPIEGVRLHYVVESLEPARLAAGAVRCEDDLLEIFLRARTDADGRFELGGLWAGSGQLQLRSDGYRATSVEDLRPVSGEDLDVGTLTMEAGGSIAGVVLDAQGRPAPGVEVVLTDSVGFHPSWPESDLLLGEQAFGNAFAQRLAVDAAGRFRAGGLEPGSQYALFARSPGHDVAWLDDLQPDGAEHVLALAPGASLRVTIVDAASGEALPEAQLTAQRLATRGDDEEVLVPLQAQPGAEPGRWIIPCAGRLGTLLVASAPGHTTRSQRAPGLGAGAEGEETVRLEREVALTGRVLDPRGAPVASATVRAALAELAREPRLESLWPFGRSDAEGRYALAGLGAGSWQVAAEAEGYVPGQPVELEVRDVERTQDFVLVPEAAIAGRAVRLDGRPAVGSPITLQPWDERRTEGDSVTRTVVDPAGRFRFDGLPAGDYRLHWVGSQLVSVAEGETAQVELVEPRRPVLYAAVLDRGQRVEDASVRVLAWTDQLGHDGEELYLESRREGAAFRLDLPEAGTYVVAAWGRQGGAVSEPRAVTVGWGEECRVELSFGTIAATARLVDAASGEGLDVGWLALTAADDSRVQVSARPANDGWVRFEGLVAGRYTVNAWARDHLPREFSDVEVPADAPDGRPVELGSFALQRAARLEVIVRSAGAPGPGAAVIYVVDAAKTSLEELDVQRLDAKTTFRLAPGRHWVAAVPGDGSRVDEDGWRRASTLQAVELDPDSPRELVLVLP